MTKALIGHTGFVGQSLKNEIQFDKMYRSVNIESICNHEFSLLICAAAPAEKWIANKNPQLDLKNIERLISCLSKVQTQRFILISTVDVFDNPVDVTEASLPRPQQAYGRNRKILEDFVINHFPEAKVIRLPALFGHGLKKNVIYDFLNNHQIEKIHSDSIYQWYPIKNLWSDINKIIKSQSTIFHMATPPLKTQDLVNIAFEKKFINKTNKPIAKYNFKTNHSHLFGRNDGYICDYDSIFRDLKSFIADQKGHVFV